MLFKLPNEPTLLASVVIPSAHFNFGFNQSCVPELVLRRPKTDEL